MLSSDPGHGVNPSLPLPTEEQIEQFESECRKRYLMSVNAAAYVDPPFDFTTAHQDAEQRAAGESMPMDGVHFFNGMCRAMLFAAVFWSAAAALGYWLWK